MAFGFLQLHGYEDPYMDITAQGVEVGSIRLAQYSGLTAPHTFMAAAYDLNDDASPFGAVHFRNKQEAGARLARAALANGYGKGGSMLGPVARDIVVVVGKGDGGRRRARPVSMASGHTNLEAGKRGSGSLAAGNVGADGKGASLGVEGEDDLGRAKAQTEAPIAPANATVPFSILISYIGVGSQGLVDSGINLFELATEVDATDTAGGQVVPSSHLSVLGKNNEQLLVEFELPVDSPFVEEGVLRILRYAYRNRPCPPTEVENPHVGTWCGLYSFPEGVPALPFVQDV
ncbi:hypothetical protein Naga_100929g1 [Nannochloropsis gaditana]|uniref:Uncharacterized protein n=1 Tax=Nannochloropsis gaditana TaxID=72520 RepID=W7TTX7_9STRA|nr:hypothetical protein Naga_100929g1 [Nannochloropsis gaditana]